jgi:hypothetical protein
MAVYLSGLLLLESVLPSFDIIITMPDIDFKMQPVVEKPEKRKPPYRTGSKYEPIITSFEKSNHNLVRVDVTDVEANYLAGQLKKLLASKGNDGVKISVRNKQVYLEKV